MAGQQFEGHPSSSPISKMSFSQLFSEPAPSPILIRPSSILRRPLSSFPKKMSAAPFRLALAGKFSHGRPPLEDIRKIFFALDLKDSISIGLMDYGHILIKVKAEADFN